MLVDLVAAVENLAEREDMSAAKALLLQGGVGGDGESVLGTLARVKGEIATAADNSFVEAERWLRAATVTHRTGITGAPWDRVVAYVDAKWKAGCQGAWLFQFCTLGQPGSKEMSLRAAENFSFRIADDIEHEVDADFLGANVHRVSNAEDGKQDGRMAGLLSSMGDAALRKHLASIGLPKFAEQGSAKRLRGAELENWRMGPKGDAENRRVGCGPSI